MRFIRPLTTKRGFTLIEMLVVIAITGILAVVLSAFFVNIVQGSINASVTTRVRSQGEIIIEELARKLHNSNAITISGSIPTTVTTTNTMTLSDNSGNLTTYTFTSNQIQVGGSRMNATDVLVDTSASCGGACSYFVVTPATLQAPASVKIVLTVYTQTSSGYHSEYATRQTLEQSSVQLGQYKK